MPPDGISFNTKVIKLINKKGEDVEAANHAMEQLEMVTDKPVPAGSLMRLKRE